ncbi:MAG: helix-turn-helix domain-containing protein [Candidatus Thiodiazotropha endolucinida]
MNGNQILLRLKQVGISFTDIAKIQSVTPQAVSAVAHRKGDSLHIAKAIAAALELPIHKVFPDRPQYHRLPDPEKRKQLLDAVRELNAA